MSKIQLLIYTLFILLEVFGIATLIEIYKKQIRKNKSQRWENYLIAGILSSVGVAILILLHIFKPILGLIGAPVWADYILYFIGFFFSQKTANMKIIKKLIKSCAKSLLLSYGFTEEQIDIIISSAQKN